MNDVVISTTPADADAVEEIRSHHAELTGALTTKVSALAGAVRAGQDAGPARDALVEWCGSALLPHARAEEEVLYPAGGALPRAQLLVEALVAEHHTLGELVDTLRRTGDPVDAVGAATALRAVFESHAEKENAQLLPALVGRLDLAELRIAPVDLLGARGVRVHRRVGELRLQLLVLSEKNAY